MARNPLKARKRFGQNFLQDQMVIADIVAAISPGADEHLVEIGPGRAALTSLLYPECALLDVIEIDKDLIPILEQTLSDASNIRIHQADALDFDYSSLPLKNEKMRVVGNLPYNITTPLLFHLLSQSEYIEDMCFMLQLEVVERICAQPGSKSYGRLSVMMQYHCEASLLFTVPPEAFEPRPKVDSAIIYLRPLEYFVGGGVPIKALNTVVTQAFSQRRKTISNTLKNMVSQTSLLELNIDLTQRPETLSVAQFVEITKVWLNETATNNGHSGDTSL